MRYSLSALAVLCALTTIACGKTSDIALTQASVQAATLPVAEATSAEPITFATMPDSVTVGNTPTNQPTRVAQVTNKTDVPITLISFAPARRGGEARGVFIVPDRDTTRSAYGGSLRRYDVHIAKMIEVANLYCNPNNGNWNSVEWNYFAGDGDINMGRFRLDCTLVQQTIAAYGVGRPERTRIYFYGASGKSEVRNIPVLDLRGYKIPDFLKFVQTLKPIGKAQRIDLEE